MSEEDVEIVERVRRLYAAYSRRDWDAYFADTDPEFEWDPTEQGGVFRGRRAITELAENWFSTWAEWQWEPEEIERHVTAVQGVRRPSQSCRGL
jgi:ketosteroid isomerase-like protein